MHGTIRLRTLTGVRSPVTAIKVSSEQLVEQRRVYAKSGFFLVAVINLYLRVDRFVILNFLWLVGHKIDDLDN